MVGLLASLRESLRIPAKPILAVGVALAITDVNAAIVVSVPTIQGWENVPLGRLLAERLHSQVIVENDVNIAAPGEHTCPMPRDRAGQSAHLTAFHRASRISHSCTSAAA